MSSELKAIFGNTLAQLVAKFVGAGLTFLTTALIIRLAGPALFGDLTKALVLIAMSFTIIDFGLNATILRRLTGTTRPQTQMVDVISARLLLSLVVVIAANVLIFVLPGGYTPAIKSVFWIGSLSIIFQGIYTSLNAWFQYQENYWLSTWSTVGGALVGALLTYYFILTHPTLANFLLAQTIGYASMAAISIFFARSVFGLTFSSTRVKNLIQSSLILGATLLASVAASKLDTIILGIYRPSGEVGEYGFAYRIFDVLLVFPAFLMNAVYPRILKGGSKKSTPLIRRTLIILGVSGCLLAIFAYLTSPWILFIRPGLDLSVITLRLLSFSLPLFFLTAPLMWQLISREREKNILIIYAIAACLNGVLNLLTIPVWGAVAAAITTGLTELWILLALVYSAKKL